MKNKFALSSYAKPTPAIWRKIGDTCLLVGSLITAEAIFTDVKWAAYTALAFTILGKAITNFFSEK